MATLLDEIIRIYEEGEYPPNIVPKEELFRLFYEITGSFIVWSYGYSKGFEEAWRRDREALRKALIALLERGARYFEERSRLYPSSTDVYREKAQKNRRLIERLKALF